ncbi:MAG: ketopantoate reductase family protein [Firmicutes bacterium]|nr:ketopantoate reductase family protein [Bacillota bacterium]MBQ4649724.1 ketopantoate reductase family protein [Bacillota bacterium]
MKRVALVGVGSLGTVCGALMTKNGVDVTLVDANKAHVDALNANGATIIGKMDEKNIPVKAITPDQMEGIYDIIFLLTKQTVNHIVLPQLVEHMDENSVICTLQNGIPEEFVSKYVGRARTVGGVTGWGACYAGPGVSELTSDPYRMVFEIGELDGSVTPRIQEIAEILGKGCHACNVITNLMGVRYTKLITNATMSGLSAALNISYGDIIDNDRVLTVAAYQANELIKIANAKDIKLEILFAGYDFYDLQFTDAEGLARAKKWLYEYFTPDRPVIASMLRDMRNNILPVEIDHIVGLPAAWGDELGIDTPCLDKCVEIVKGFQEGKRPMPSVDLIEEFVIPEI